MQPGDTITQSGTHVGRGGQGRWRIYQCFADGCFYFEINGDNIAGAGSGGADELLTKAECDRRLTEIFGPA